jgi:HlyD family secretion protein
MHARWIKRAIVLLTVLLVVIAAVWYAWPQPVAVDLAMARRGPLEITVDDEGKTRIKHVYTVSAPVSGKVLRISHPSHHNQSPSHHVGDEVVAGETVVAVMQPMIPGFLDVRFREELRSAVAAAEAAAKLAEAEVRRIEAALAFAQSELGRAEQLVRTKTISAQAWDKAKLDVETNKAALASAKAQLEVRRSEREMAAARLIEPSAAPTNAGCCIEIRAPETGRLIRILKESEDVVVAGTPLLEIGDPLDLEVIADLLSTDAVQVKPGAPVMIDGWGGPPLRGRVSRVDPAGFVKVSALGIEEQRVRTTIDIVDPPQAWSRLGHDYG